MRADGAAIKLQRARNELSEGVHDPADVKTGPPVFHHLLDRPAAMRDHGRATGHGLDHHEPERLVPLNGKKERRRVTQEFILLWMIDGTDPADLLTVDP